MKRDPLPRPVPPRDTWSRLIGEPFDVLVVGGGIHGAGVAREAAHRGLRTALIERGDWASGTSSRSSKLFHGGLRYLRQGVVGLVRESLRERDLHLRLAPELVRRLRFRVPATAAGPPRWQVRTGIALYDLLTLGASRARVWGDEPSYDDAQIDDARFCLEIMRDARRGGARCQHYTECLEWVRDGERITGARIHDRLSGEEGRVAAEVCVNAAGPWASDLRGRAGSHSASLRLTRGTHVVLRGETDGEARLFFAPQDHRPLFLLPFEPGFTLLGTTDIDEAEPSEEPVPTPAEIEYLVEGFVTQFPAWSRWVPTGVQCGLRPLVREPGDPSDVTREERVEEHEPSGLISILGGKYTTYRAVAERVVDRASRRLGRGSGSRPTRERALPAGDVGGEPAARIERAFAEEDAVTLGDVLFRRTAWGHTGQWDEHLAAAAAALGRRWNLSAPEAEAKADEFRSLMRHRLAPLAAWRAGSNPRSSPIRGESLS